MIYHVVSGSGHSVIGDKTFHWTKGDSKPVGPASSTQLIIAEDDLRLPQASER